MLHKLLDMLLVEENDLPRVRSLLETLLSWLRVLAEIVAATSTLVLLVRLTSPFGVLSLYNVQLTVGSLLLLAAWWGLHKLNLRAEHSLPLTSVMVNLLLAAVVLYVTWAVLPLSSLPGPVFILYALPILIAVLLLTPGAGLIWSAVLALMILLRILVVVIISGESVELLAVFEGIVYLALLTLLSWFVGHSFHRTRQTLWQQIRQGQASIEIGRTITSTLDLPLIMRQAVQLIYESFDFYHVGLFILDDANEAAVLMEAAGEMAAELKERSLPLPLSGTSVVAAAINQKKVQMVFTWRESLDPYGRPIEFTYGRLPTRMEMALPLQIGERVLGALDIHSIGVEPFPKDDVRTLEGLSGHIANTLEGARLIEDIQQRHQELEQAYRQTERRMRYLEVTADVARSTSSLLNLQELLDKAVDLISERLGHYQASIFLIDEASEWAVLTASSGESGQRFMSQGYRLRVGGQSIVGWVTGVGQPRISSDVAQDSVYLYNPEVPNTRSEIALPLIVGDRVVGALDVQSEREAAFGQDDMAVLQIMADQIATGFENTRLFHEADHTLEELKALQRYYVTQEWERVFRQRGDLKAEYRSLGIAPTQAAWSPEMQIALEKSEPVALPDLSAMAGGRDGQGDGEGESVLPIARSALAVPIKLRDEVIGVLDLQELQDQRHWTDDDVEMAAAVADQLALALENARLFEEAQRRASQLAAASEVARNATAILDVPKLLDETVHLISEQFGYYHAGVFLLDEQGEYAVLQAASSEGGRRMLERGHKLKVGEVGLVGHAALTGEPRIASDVGADAMYFDNPDLPDTRSEMSLPLKVRGRVIGVLDVQSAQATAFSEEDISALQTMADQLATAITNARLFQEARSDAQRRALISEMLQAAATSLDPDELLHRAGETISLHLQVPSALFVWEEEEGVFRPIAFHDSAAADIPLPPGFERVTREMNTALFEAVEERRPRVLENIGALGGPLAALAQQAQAQSVIYAPLTSRGRVLGVFGIGAVEGHSLMGADFADLLAANLSVALENARLYQEAVHTAERLAEVDRLKSQFLANMSHELRTPLNSIIGFSRVILKEIDGPLTEMQRTDLQAVYDSGQHLLGLINDILEVSKVESGKMELTFEAVDLKEIIKGVMATAIALVKDKPDVKLQQVVPQDMPTIIGDTRRIRQAILNLVSNAAKFTHEGFIRVEASATDTEAIISVADSGIGISPDKIETIFEPFTQADASTTREFGGTGLGLSISNSFVEMHGGRMWVESEIGKGSTFYIALPIAGPPQQREQVEEEEQAESGQKTVLCVEDDEGVITLFRRYLSKQGYRVVGLTNSMVAVERARELVPYAITLDVMMPGKDGWQVIHDLKSDSQTHDIPVIMCSIIGENERGLSLGAADYLVKPILEQELLAALDRLDREAGQQLVLVVDDQEDDRNLLRRMLEAQEGYEVMEASGGQEAIALIKQTPPHVIILDLMMPNVDGFAVLEAVKMDKATRSIPIIVVTAKELTQEEREVLNSGVEALLQKGIFEQQELLADVAAALERVGRKSGGKQKDAQVQPPGLA